jgi:hypothetical protein
VDTPAALTAFFAFFAFVLADFTLRGFFAFFFGLVVFLACERRVFFFVCLAAFLAVVFLLEFFALLAISPSPLGRTWRLSSRRTTNTLWHASVKSTASYIVLP